MNTARDRYMQELREQMDALQEHLDDVPDDVAAARILELTNKHYMGMLAQHQQPPDSAAAGYWLGTGGTKLSESEFDERFGGNTMEAVMVGGWKWVPPLTKMANH